MFCFCFAWHRGVLAEMSRNYFRRLAHSRGDRRRYWLIGALHIGALMLAGSAVRAAADDIFGIKAPAIPFTGLGGLTGPAYDWWILCRRPHGRGLGAVKLDGGPWR